MGVLDGLRVLEMTGLGPAPVCGALLADLGADVIVIERPSQDSGRPRPAELWHRGKRSIELDLKAPGAVDIALQLVEQSDALIEGMRPGVMERLGLGPDVCIARKPSLVYGRMTGWGQQGPLKEVPGHDGNFIAVSGALYLTSPPAQRPEPTPSLLGDVAGGMLYLAVGVLAGMLRARIDGRGQVVDAAMVDGSAHMLNLMLALVAARDNNFDNVRPDGYGRHWVRSYRCADGKWLRVEPDEPKFYAELLRRLGLEHDSRFAQGQGHRADWPALVAQLDAVFATKTQAQWCELLEGTNACVSPILTPAEAGLHPHMKARGIYETIDGVLQAAPAPRFSRTPSAPTSRVPPRGAHTEAILGELRR